MSLDIAVILAYLTGRVLVPYRFRLPRRPDPAGAMLNNWAEPSLVPDLFDIPVPWSSEYLLKTWISMEGKLDCSWKPVFESVFCFPASLARDDDRLRSFLNGREQVYTSDEIHSDARDLHINTYTLGHYSYFFYLDDERRRAVVNLMKQLRPKQPYLHAADRIAASLGPFNAIHLRRGDFLSNDLSKNGISRAASVTGQEIADNLATRMRRNDLLVVCTDGSPHDEFFDPIKTYFREVIFLDRYLRENNAIREMMSQLPSNDDAVEVLLTQLVASKAMVFAGTLFSTFTGLIHRLRGFAEVDSNFLYCYNDFLSPSVRFEQCEFQPVADGPYSWNRIRYPVSPDAYSWLREWPEAFETGLASAS